MHENTAIDEIFGQAIQIKSAQHRAAFLEQACNENQELLRDLKKLVGDFFRAGEFLQDPVAEVGPAEIITGGG